MTAIKAPTRIDLAGGTLDIWPLSVMFAPSASINAAIDLYATVEVRKGRGVSVTSINTGKRTTYTEGAPEKEKTLFHRALDIFPVKGKEFIVGTGSPAGAGLGGSSSLLIAFLRTLDRIGKTGLSGGEILDIAKNIEARHLGIPTGVQDYVAALNGGLNAVLNAHGGQKFLPLNADPAGMEKRVVLAYSGESRISGVPNWTMLKNAVEKERKTVKAFEKIASNSLKVLDALFSEDLGAIGKLIDMESSQRELLGRGVMTKALRKAFKTAAKNGGHPKVCGAGGGGCFIVWCEPGRTRKVAEALSDIGMKPLDFRIAPSTGKKR